MRRIAMTAGLLGALLPAAAQAQGPGVWTTKTSLPAARNEVAAAAVNGKLYVFGGSIAGQSDLKRTEEYDPASNKWTARADMPYGGSHMIAVALNNKVYVVGGFKGARHANALSDAAEYDPAKNTWRSLAPLSSPRGSVALAAVRGKVHAIGGRGMDLKTTTVHQVLDPATGKWSDAAPMTKARDHTATIAVDGKIHMIGGRFDEPKDTTDVHEVFDPATNAWTSAPALPTRRSSLAVAYYKGMILVLGGETTTASQIENEGFDVKAGKWAKLAPLPSPRHGIAGTAVGNVAYFAGGAEGVGGNGVSDKLFIFTLP
jgi:N-acetylneuraminic acid mutarotase